MKQEFTDICIPNGNEQAFIDVARKLGTTSLIFLYEPKKINKEIQEIQQKNPDIKITAANLILKNTNNKGLNFAKANLGNLENKYVTHLFDLETIEEKDNHHYRRSGLNQAIAKKIKEQDKTIIINIESLITSKEQSLIIGRIQQNLELVKKYKLKIAIASLATKPENMRGKEEQKALIKTLGYESMAKKAVQEINEQIQII